MTRIDPMIAAADAKRTAMMLRDARAVLHRVDLLMSIATAADDPAVLLIAEARETLERLVTELGRRGQMQQRLVREAVRRRAHRPICALPARVSRITSPASGPSAIATATARLASTTGVGSCRISSPYSAAILRQSVASALGAVEWHAAIAAWS